MDPNANLLEQERILRAFHAETDLLDARTRNIIASLSSEHERLWQLRDDLRSWLAAGGFEPDWTKAPKASRYYGR